jgi:nucleoside-diphosphate-sugar epimerase
MKKNEANYLDKYGLPHTQLSMVIDSLNESKIHLFGATGALGLSFLKILELYRVIPKGITLYTRESSNLDPWLKYAEDLNVNINYIFLSDNLDNVNLSTINNSSTVCFFLGSAQPQKFMLDPKSLFKININLLSEIALREPKHVFFSSTSEIYSGVSDVANENIPTVSTPQHPRGSYIESKRCGEAVLSSLSSKYTKSVSFRVALASPPYTIPGDNRILADLVQMAKDKQMVSLKGGWDSIRQYQWGPVCILKMLWAGYFGGHGVYNISGGERITLEQLGIAIAKKFNVKYINTRQELYNDLGAPNSVQISIKRLEQELNYIFDVEKIDELLDVYIN